MNDAAKDAADDALERSRGETLAAFENRALVYRHLLDELADEIGIERATEIMKRAVYARGLDVGRKYAAAAAAGDLAEVGHIFCESSPACGTLFHPAVEECGDDVLVLSMSGCPLVDAWEAAGLPPDRVDLLCEIAAAVDEGTFEGAGLEITFLERAGMPGARRCLLSLRASEVDAG